jgi:hypothetical protein
LALNCFLRLFVPSSSAKSSSKPRPPKAAARARRDETQRPHSADRPASAARSSTTLILLDTARLQAAAWAEYHTAQKRHEKAARDLHRHEEVDTPAHEQWLNQTFPVLLTRLRNLQEEITTKTSQIRMVRAMAAYTGRSAKRLWNDFKAGALADDRGPRPEERRRGFGDEDRKPEDGDADEFFEDDAPPRYRARGQAATAKHAAQQPLARDIYRRLVQRLHPDRGGKFTPARQRLWHEVQLAWAQRDADWLARLEVELDSSADLGLLGLVDIEPLSVKSPLSRLRRAIAELTAARRDTERKLREYRQTPPWRFTLTPRKRDVLHRRTERALHADLVALERQLAYLDKTIRHWEEPTLGRPKPRHTLPDW